MSGEGRKDGFHMRPKNNRDGPTHIERQMGVDGRDKEVNAGKELEGKQRWETEKGRMEGRCTRSQQELRWQHVIHWKWSMGSSSVITCESLVI